MNNPNPALGSAGQSYGIYPEANDLGWPAKTLEDLYAELCEYSVPNVVPVLARFNVGFQTGRADDLQYGARVAAYFLSPSDLRRVNEVQTPAVRVVITPFHLRQMIAALIRCGRCNGGRSLAIETDRHYLGRLMLYAPKLLAPQVAIPDGSDTEFFLALHLLLTHTGYRQNSRLRDEIVTKGYVSRLIKTLDLNVAIQEARGFTAFEFQTALMTLWASFHSHTPKHVWSQSSSFLDFDYLMGHIKVGRPLGETIRRTYGHDLGTSRMLWTPDTIDLSELARKPLAFIDDRVICLDFDFLEAKVGRELLHLIRTTSEEKLRGPIGHHAGRLFEEMCDELLSIAANARSSAWMAPKPLITKGKAQPDALFVDGETAIVFEFKSAPLPDYALFGTDPKALGTAIMERFIVGKPREAQGFIQCANHLRTMLGDPRKYHLDAVRRIVPCVVTIEEALTFELCNTYAVSNARPLFKEFGSLVHEPVLLHTEDLVALVQRSKLCSLPEMLVQLGPTILAEGSTKNQIMHRWPKTTLDRSGLRVVVKRRADFFDDALEHLKNEVDPMAPPCLICGAATRFMVSGSPRDSLKHLWGCKSCRHTWPATPEEIAEQENLILQERARYRGEG